jgi:acyl carrier protein
MSLRPCEVLKRIRQRLPYLAPALEPSTKLDQLSMDSLDLVELLIVLDELFNVRLTVEDFKDMRTVGELAALVTARAGGEVLQP